MKQAIDIEYFLSSKGLFQEISFQTEKGLYKSESYIPGASVRSGETFIDAWDRLILQGHCSQPLARHLNPIRVVDLFCGCGGFTEGIKQAFNSAGFNVEITAAVDIDESALSLYTLNHSPLVSFSKDVNDLARCVFRQNIDNTLSLHDPSFQNIGIETLEILMQGCDVLLAGPPCQGHSNLNNHSRRNDPRNNLYLAVATYAALLSPKVIAIENVSSVLKDRSGNVHKTHMLLESLGYSVHSVLVKGIEVGLPQTRNRHFTIAYNSEGINPRALMKSYSSYFLRPRSVSWALQMPPTVCDLQNCFYTPSAPSKQNLERINWLHDMNVYDLPFDHRPVCHHENHNYKSVYGRLCPDLPSGTITTGFNSPGRGRFVHPSERRVITACEASLIQGFPTSYKFYTDGLMPSRNVHSKVIGDAVSPMMARAVGNLLAVQIASEFSSEDTNPDLLSVAA
ncbi:DNA cytosine methyltransferase [Synechococcus sp. L2F]|uniref:DNA cytosine methyltransferase n=1 Tax=Synechococcus sp. L2F TaxID=2823739 RepID=UPI0020CC3C73|nr:DNA cytosine methyltransferase [Synechococcus sp. L2F]MCP9826920.1 DNA cytosine methyltransferase [Synechococcus sp. L2F]